jgi:hypothetical protein
MAPTKKAKVESRKMQGIVKAWGILVLGIVIASATAPAAAQKTSRASQVTLVATMPETLMLSLNPGDPAHFTVATNTNANPGNTASATTTWSLKPGRAKVVTVAYFKDPAAPVLIAVATPLAISLPSDSSLGGTLPFEFHMHVPVSSMQVHSMTIMETQRAGANTNSLPTSNSPEQTPDSPPDTSGGTLKIQALPIL